MMAGIRGSNTKPERIIRSALHRRGLRFRLNGRQVAGRPDLVLPRHKVAVFVHGCFWHGHDCKHGSKRPKDNAGYWSDKLQKNRVRDARVLAELRARGWTGEVVWECELKNEAALSARLDALFG